MKTFLLTLLATTASLAHAAPDSIDEASICAQKVIRVYRPIIDQPQFNDKFKHCALSCVLALQCGRIEAGAAGAMKELMDLFTRDTADWNDWRADRKGIALAVKREATTAQECYAAAHRLYPDTIRAMQTW